MAVTWHCGMSLAAAIINEKHVLMCVTHGTHPEALHEKCCY
jgi:hypothetical protein